MSPLLLRPHVRLPWQVLAGIAAAAYLIRAALRGWDFSVSVLDALVFAALALILIARPLIAHLLEEPGEDGSADPDQGAAATRVATTAGEGTKGDPEAPEDDTHQQPGAEGDPPQDE